MILIEENFKNMVLNDFIFIVVKINKKNYNIFSPQKCM